MYKPIGMAKIASELESMYKQITIAKNVSELESIQTKFGNGEEPVKT